MYNDFYALSFNPFDKSISEKDSFLSRDFQEMTHRLNYLKETRGIGVFTIMCGQSDKNVQLPVRPRGLIDVRRKYNFLLHPIVICRLTICGWSENNTYLIFDGKLTDNVEDEFRQVKKLFLLNSHSIPVPIIANKFPLNPPISE